MAGAAGPAGRSSTASSAVSGGRWAGGPLGGSGGAAGVPGSGVRGTGMGGAWGGARAFAMLIIAARPACCDSAKPLAAVTGGGKPGAYAGMRSPLPDSPLR